MTATAVVMFAAWGAVAYRGRWFVIAVVSLATLAGGAFGLGVFGHLSQGGYTDTASESTQAGQLAARVFGPQPDVVIVYSAPVGHTVTEPGVAARARSVLHALPVRAESSYWDTGSPAMITADHRSALATFTLDGSYQQIRDRIVISGLTAHAGGPAPVQDATNARSRSDLTLAEAISVPITLLLLVVIFGSVLAAALPVLVGVLAILGSLGVLRLISLGTAVNGFAPNVVSLLGLGLAIDYGLFTVGRFREELAAGHDVGHAVRRTVATSGRTVAFSATLLVIALSSLLVFPIPLLRSLAYGGMSAVGIAALVSVTLLPAMLGVLGTRLSSHKHAAGPAWLRTLSSGVLRRPLAVALPILAVLLALGAPFLSVRFGAADEKQLPPGDPARQAVQLIEARFPASGENAARILLRGPDHPFVAAAARIPGVAQVVPGPTKDGVTLITATLRGDPLSTPAEHAVRQLRALDRTALVGGFTASVVDTVQSIVDRLWVMIAVLIAATLTVMFLAFRSVLLPVKAVVLSALSLSATFGVLVWIFQLGHGAGLLGVTPQPVQPAMIVLIGAVVFGLSTDYETFLLSRMVEARARGASSRDAIRTGLVRTGRMISSAALLLIVVTGAFGLSQLATMRFIGVGMVVALVLDATVVRLMLVPAVLRLLGDAAWWAPRRSGGQGRHLVRPGQHDKSLHAQRDGDVEDERAGGQATARPAAVDQQVQTEVRADRDQPQHDGDGVALPVQDAVLAPHPGGVRTDRAERGGHHETAGQHTDRGGVERLVLEVHDDFDDSDHTEDQHEPRAAVLADGTFPHLPGDDQAEDQDTDDDADKVVAHGVHHVRSRGDADQSRG